MEKRNPLARLFAVTVSLLYGVIAAGQILGLLQAYRPFWVFTLALALGGLVFQGYWRGGRSFFRPFSAGGNRWLSGAFVLAALLIFVLLVFYPLARWPYSPITPTLTWDAGLYHFPKAAEMVATGSAWDLSIAYGEYPFGYESLIAASFLLNHDRLLIGAVHALIALYFFLAFALLFVQRTRLPQAPVLLFLSVLFLGSQLLPALPGMWMFWTQLILIGKNDAFLAAALLAVLAHMPRSAEDEVFFFGLAATSMIALSIKPNAALVVLFAWSVSLFFLWRSGRLADRLRELGLAGLLMLPGVLWAFRNLVIQGTLFSPETLQISEWSIAANLTNPYFYRHIPFLLYAVLGIVAAAGGWALFRPDWRLDAATAVVLLATFALTPASAFFGSTERPAEIAWRFGMALAAWAILLAWKMFEPVFLLIWRRVAGYPPAALALSVLVLAFGVWCVWSQRDLLRSYPEKAIVLYDQYSQPVGVNGYRSAYDYVQQNVHHAVVIVENGLPYYLYDRDFTNSVTRSRPADYAVFLRTPWINRGGYPETLAQPEWAQNWELVYEDPEGRVYRRR